MHTIVSLQRTIMLGIEILYTQHTVKSDDLGQPRDGAHSQNP